MNDSFSENLPASGENLRVLLVEDRPTDVELCLHELRKAGFAVTADVVETPEEFAERVSSETHDIVLADYRLPNWTGVEAIDHLREQGKDIPVILVTGTLGDEKAVECIKRGATDYVLKGHLPRLPVAVRRALQEKKLRDERRRLEEEARVRQRLEEVLRFKSEFIANMSHELRTPLNSIIGFSDLLINRISGELNEKQAKYANHILQAGRHLLALINDILDLSRVEAGKMELWPQTFPLSEALEAVVTLVKPQAAKKRISLYSTINSDVTTITADPLRFKQVMFNLLGNAVKFTDEQGQIRVAARRLYGSELPVCEKPCSAGEPSIVTPEPQQEFVEISVQDTGIGISPEDQEKLFQEFSQVGGECARRQRGAGLGLALTKKLVELHGGRIRAESPGEGQGSTFTVTLPLKGPMALSGFEPSTSPAERLQNQPADPPTSGRGSTEGTASGES